MNDKEAKEEESVEVVVLKSSKLHTGGLNLVHVMHVSTMERSAPGCQVAPVIHASSSRLGAVSLPGKVED